jgi:hypothetical protein
MVIFNVNPLLLNAAAEILKSNAVVLA